MLFIFENLKEIVLDSIKDNKKQYILKSDYCKDCLIDNVRININDNNNKLNYTYCMHCIGDQDYELNYMMLNNY